MHEAVLRRDFGFKTLAIRNIVANLASGGVAVAMALQNFGIASLIAQRLIAAVLLSAIVWRSVPWTPSFTFSKAICRQQLAFGGSLTLSNLLAMGNQRVIDLIVGYALGPTPLGYLRIAWRGLDMLLEIGIRPITQVTLSTFSALQHDKAALARAYSRITQVISLVAFPAFLGAGLSRPSLSPSPLDLPGSKASSPCKSSPLRSSPSGDLFQEQRPACGWASA